MQNFASGRPGWFFISVKPKPGQFSHLAIWYKATQGQLFVLDQSYVTSIQEDDVSLFSAGNVPFCRQIIAEEIFDRIRDAISTNSLDLINRTISEITEDKIYGRLLELVVPPLKRNDEGYLPFIELLLRTEYLIAPSGTVTPQQLFERLSEMMVQRFRLVENSTAEDACEFVLEDAYQELLTIESRIERQKRAAIS